MSNNHKENGFVQSINEQEPAYALLSVHATQMLFVGS